MPKFPVDIRFHLFSCCTLVRGITRSCIYDIQRGNFEYVPNTLVDILEEYVDCTYNDLLNVFEDFDDQCVLYEYFEMLYEKEYIFFSELDNASFPKYSNDFFRPYHVSTLVIDICDFDENYLNLILENIHKVKVECLVVRVINISYEDIYKTLSKFNDISTRTIQLFICRESKLLTGQMENLFEVNNRLSLIIKVDTYESENSYKRGVLIRTKTDIINDLEKVIDVSDFIPNTDLYLESLSYNTFYNKRVYINSVGDVFRFEKDKDLFGNLKSKELTEIIQINGFDFFWNINKDKIGICKDCEYRYMCTDNRLPLYNSDKNEWFFEEPCNYDPYSAKWNSISL